MYIKKNRGYSSGFHWRVKVCVIIINLYFKIKNKVNKKGYN